MSTVILTPRAQKDVNNLPQEILPRIYAHINSLKADPFLGKKLKGDLKDHYSVRVWPYRIIYILDKRTNVWIVRVSHRQEVYK